MEKTLNQTIFYSFLIGYIFKIEIPKFILDYVMSNDISFDANVEMRHVILMLKGGDLSSSELRQLVFATVI